MQRYSTTPFPPYRFLPGLNPHPYESPQGHSYGKPEPPVVPLISENWSKNEAYLYGIDLYNHHYWWESHEAWEGLWKADSDETTRDFLQGLIKISAAFMKWQSKTPRGVKVHYASAMKHLKKVSTKHSVYLGIDLVAHIVQLEKTFQPVLDAPPEQWPSPAENYPLVSLSVSR